ncbi:MAG: hypothetical protein JJD98_00410 [Polaromonas sp.]|nr:hypothetical protein [Polaromonas sp.]
MNCKQGDLAIVVRVSLSANNWMIGKIVKCEGFEVINGCFGWMVESPIVSPPGYIFDYEWVADHCLRPIRDQPGNDETLTWASLPQDQGVTA